MSAMKDARILLAIAVGYLIGLGAGIGTIYFGSGCPK